MSAMKTALNTRKDRRHARMMEDLIRRSTIQRRHDKTIFCWRLYIARKEEN